MNMKNCENLLLALSMNRYSLQILQTGPSLVRLSFGLPKFRTMHVHVVNFVNYNYI
jgi:hypothetical protein